jgi:hypothetical protein
VGHGGPTGAQWNRLPGGGVRLRGERQDHAGQRALRADGACARASGAYSGKIRHPADRHWQLRELTGLPLAAAAGDGKELAGCMARLKAGSVLG